MQTWFEFMAGYFGLSSEAGKTFGDEKIARRLQEFRVALVDAIYVEETFRMFFLNIFLQFLPNFSKRLSLVWWATCFFMLLDQLVSFGCRFQMFPRRWGL